MLKLIKNTIIIIGIVLLLIVFILNVIYTSNISDDIKEKVVRQTNSILIIIVSIIIALGICILLNKTKKINKKLQIAIIIVVVLLYLIAQIVWIQERQAEPVADQRLVYNAAVNISKDNWEKLKTTNYLELYPQQLTLATTYSIILKIFGTDIKILQYCNAIANTISLIAILLITKQLSKQYEININKALLIMSTFITLPLLSTFIYGDFISLPMCLFSIYFIIKYGEKNKKRYAIISAIFISIAFIMRMNSLIYIIALFIYLILDILKTEKKLAKIVVIIVFLAIAILPTNIIKTAIQHKLEFEKEKAFPTTGFLLMGMSETERANGWYNNNIASIGMSNVEKSKEVYKNAIKIRVESFIKKPLYAIKFYASKTVSMWAENTYSAIWYNQSFNFNKKSVPQPEKQDIDNKLIEARNDIIIYQKALILIIFGTSICVLLKYKDKLSNEVLLLVIIFIGGFLFHTLWEAKSRYIISYIIVLIPVASIIINEGKNVEKFNYFQSIWTYGRKDNKNEKV